MIQEKNIKTKNCLTCKKQFKITDKDKEFYEKISPKIGKEIFEIPTPKLCPDCREQRRLSFSNEINLYQNTCLLCDSKIISRFHEESGINVYCNECWASDKWDAKDYGMDFNFNKTFFEQVEELTKKVPFQNMIGSLSNVKNNAVYTNYTAEISNSYLVFESDYVSDCFYSRRVRKSSNIMDSTVVNNSEYCYSCIDIDECYNVFYSNNSKSCNNSYFLENCSGCNNCIGCINLVNKDYYIFNEKVAKEEYLELKEKLSDSSFLENFKIEVKEFFLKNPYPNNKIITSENCTGSVIFNSKNCEESYDIIGCQDIKYCTDVNNSNDLMDVSSYGSNSHLMYESVSVGRYSSNLLFCNTIGKGDNLIYCIDTKKSKNCFGCVNMKWEEYCILNKQYTREEYEKLIPKIIEHMKKTGEWGEFFPSHISLFGYNETLAQEYFPLLKDEVNKKGYNWSNYEAPFPKVKKVIKAYKLPDKISDIPDDILNWAIECVETKKPYKIIKEELDFYRKHNLPIPQKHPDIRHMERTQKRGKRKIYDRKCDKCYKIINSNYSRDSEKIIYCNNCYQKDFY